MAKKTINRPFDLAIALRTAINKKIKSTGYTLEAIDDDIDYATSDILDGDNCSCGQILIEQDDYGLTCNIAEWLTDPKYDDCYNTAYFGSQYDPRLNKTIAMNWNDKNEFNGAVNGLVKFISEMPTPKKKVA